MFGFFLVVCCFICCCCFFFCIVVFGGMGEFLKQRLSNALDQSWSNKFCISDLALVTVFFIIRPSIADIWFAAIDIHKKNNQIKRSPIKKKIKIGSDHSRSIGWNDITLYLTQSSYLFCFYPVIGATKVESSLIGHA